MAPGPTGNASPTTRSSRQSARIARKERTNSAMRFISLKQTLLAGAVAVVLGGGTIGYALAQQGQTPTPRTDAQDHAGGKRGDAFLQAVADKLGISVDRLRQAMTDARAEVRPAQDARPG